MILIMMYLAVMGVLLMFTVAFSHLELSMYERGWALWPLAWLVKFVFGLLLFIWIAFSIYSAYVMVTA